MVIKLEQIYNKLLNDNGIEKDISNIDSLGINVSEYQNDFPFELKVYYQPEEDIEKKENDPELIQFVFDKKMVKYRCVVKGTELQRNYVVLDNQTYLNMKGFSEKIKKIFPDLQEDIGKIPALIPKKEKKYLPIHILGVKNNNKYDILSEKILQKLILEDIEDFLEELGIGFTFIKSEYPIKLGNRYNYIDLLLYNIKYKCYVVVELKVTELKKEHTGQIMTYMNYIDKNIKTVEENDTVGIIICKQDNEYVIKYCSDDRIIAREYELV